MGADVDQEGAVRTVPVLTAGNMHACRFQRVFCQHLEKPPAVLSDTWRQRSLSVMCDADSVTLQVSCASSSALKDLWLMHIKCVLGD